MIITACIAAHPGRFSNGKLERAFASVMRQTRRPDRIVVVNDEGRRGAGWTRQQILDLLPDGPDEWMAWLDSDDEWFPQHLEACADTATRTESWFVFPGYDAPGGDPLGHFGLPFNPATPHHTTITFLVRVDLAKQAGFPIWEPPVAGIGNEDWAHITRMCQYAVANNIRMTHLAERTWRYNIDGGNSSGLPGQGDAR